MRRGEGVGLLRKIGCVGLLHKRRWVSSGVWGVLWFLVLAEGEHADLGAPDFAAHNDAVVWYAHDEGKLAPARNVGNVGGLGLQNVGGWGL